MADHQSFRIRLASFADIEIMLSWANNENWNPGIQDAFAFQIIDPHGFFIGYLDDEPIACISTVKYSPTYAFLGLFIVSPKYRGQGFGTQIWQHAMDYAKQCTIGLDGVIAQQNRYRTLGFQFAYRNIRYKLTQKLGQNENHQHLRRVDQLPLAELFEYDQIGFPTSRNAFLTAWLLQTNAISLVYVHDQKIKGYGVIRECQMGYKIGPLFADTEEIASIIFQGLCDAIDKKHQPIFLDIPEPNLHAKKLVESFSMEPVFEVARMYHGKSPDISLDHIFGMTTFEVG